MESDVQNAGGLLRLNYEKEFIALKRPNFVFICTDQQRNDSLGCCGNRYAVTPHLDGLAADGVRFKRHNTPCPICSPSRASFLTGLYPRHHKLTINGMALGPEIPTLPAMLSQAGYRTYGIGKHHLQPILAPDRFRMPESEAFWQRPESKDWKGPYYGFQEVQFVIGEADKAGQAGHYANWLKNQSPDGPYRLTADASLDTPPNDLDEVWKCALPADLHYNHWIAKQAVNVIDQATQPFFLFVSFPDPHHPFSPPRPYCNRFDPDEMPLPHKVSGELDKMPPYYRNIFRPGNKGVLKSYWGSSADDEQGFLLNTAGLSETSIRRAIAHTYGMVTMIDDCVGDVLWALEKNGLNENTIILFTSDHGELLGDHGLLHKGPPPYRQLREIPLLVKGPGLPSGKTIDILTTHLDLAPTLLDLAAIEYQSERFDGQTLAPLLTSHNSRCKERDAIFGEYHPRSPNKLYNQTIQTDKWRLTLYPQQPGWGELFDLEVDPHECNNLYADKEYISIIRILCERLHQEFSPQPQVEGRRIAKW